MIQQTTTQPAPDRVAAPIVATVAVTKAARSMFFVLLTALVAYQFEITYAFPPRSTQFLVSLASFAGLLRPILGYWGDVRPLGTHRRKNFMSLGNLMFLASISLLLTLPNPMGGSGYLIILVSFVVYGFGESFIDVSTDALMLDVATTAAEKSRVQAFARLGAVAGSLGTYALAMATIGPGAPYPALLAVIAVAIVVGTCFTLKIPEPSITRGQVLEQVAREQPTIPAGYKTTLWIAGIAFALVPFSEGIVNVPLEPWLIWRYGALPDIFYAVELASAAISVVAILVIMTSFRRRTWNVAALIVPSGIVGVLYYAGLPWLAPNLASYAVWNTLKGVAGVVSVLGIERTLMDVVMGARKGATFQIFVVFTIAGSFGGQLLGSGLGAVMPMEGLLVLAGVVMAGAIAIYALALAPRLKQ